MHISPRRVRGGRCGAGGAAAEPRGPPEGEGEAEGWPEAVLPEVGEAAEWPVYDNSVANRAVSVSSSGS